MINKQIKNNKGFTLVETMFAVFILTFTIAGLMTVVANSLFAARYARDEITVNYLLQEAIDYIRNDRDTIVFLGGGAGSTDTPWNNFYTKYSNCSNTYGCYFDVLTIILNPLNPSAGPQRCSISDSCPYLYYDKDATSGSFYTYDTNNGVKTNFQRKIIVKQAINPDEIDVTVTVDWKNGGLPVTRSLETSFMKWQP